MLVADLKVLLASSYAYQLKAHMFHWNVEGSDFAQLHEFFGNVYQEVFDSVDQTNYSAPRQKTCLHFTLYVLSVRVTLGLHGDCAYVRLLSHR